MSTMERFAFRSEELPSGFDDRARLSAWRDFLAESYGRHEISALPGRPFSQRLLGTRFNHRSTPVDVLRFSGTVDRMSWTSRGQAAPRSSHFVLCFNRQPGPLSVVQLGRETLLDLETPVLVSCTEPGDIRKADPHDFWAIAIEQVLLGELVGDVEDLVARPLPRSIPALRHLRRYLDILPSAAETEDDQDLLAHVGTTLIDLVALALGAGRDAAELATMRGLRAARLHEIVKEIRKRFAEPAFSPHHLARRMGVTDRYIQDLLHDSGSSFTQRVLELRLQRARAMLADSRHDRPKIGEIASASGFNEIPYFNRCFRRRFGTTPTQSRGHSQF
jgi:AraC-like DNA-binding protein